MNKNQAYYTNFQTTTSLANRSDAEQWEEPRLAFKKNISTVFSSSKKYQKFKPTTQEEVRSRERLFEESRSR